MSALQIKLGRFSYYPLFPSFSIYNDVAFALKSLTSQGKQIYTYSAGSSEAQKLLFTYTETGDLSSVSTYFRAIVSCILVEF